MLSNSFNLAYVKLPIWSVMLWSNMAVYHIEACRIAQGIKQQFTCMISLLIDLHKTPIIIP